MLGASLHYDKYIVVNMSMGSVLIALEIGIRLSPGSEHLLTLPRSIYSNATLFAMALAPARELSSSHERGRPEGGRRSAKTKLSSN